MIEKRILSSHTYNQKIAEEILEALVGTFYPTFVTLKDRLSRENSQIHAT